MSGWLDFRLGFGVEQGESGHAFSVILSLITLQKSSSKYCQVLQKIISECVEVFQCKIYANKLNILCVLSTVDWFVKKACSHFLGKPPVFCFPLFKCSAFVRHAEELY